MLLGHQQLVIRTQRNTTVLVMMWVWVVLLTSKANRRQWRLHRSRLQLVNVVVVYSACFYVISVPVHCGVVWCGVVCGAMPCGAVRCRAVWCGGQCSAVQCSAQVVSCNASNQASQSVILNVLLVNWPALYRWSCISNSQKFCTNIVTVNVHWTGQVAWWWRRQCMLWERPFCVILAFIEPCADCVLWAG